MCMKRGVQRLLEGSVSHRVVMTEKSGPGVAWCWAHLAT